MHSMPQYKPDIKFNIANYNYPDISNHADILELINRITGHISILRTLHIKGIMISFKYVRKVDKASLEVLIQELANLHVRSGINIGLGDYSHTFFPILLELIKSTSISLYKTLTIMSLAVGTSSKYSSVLMYIEDKEESKSIASFLINNHYFVIVAPSLEVMKHKLQYHRDLFDHVLIESHFGALPQEVTVNFNGGIFTYTFQGRLDQHLKTTIDTKIFKERLIMGFKVFIFDMANIINMDMHAAYILVEMLQLAQKYDTTICLVGLNKESIDNNAYSIMEKNPFWNFKGDISDIHNDPDIKEDIAHQHTRLQSMGISKRIIELMPQFIKATKQILECLDIKDVHIHTQQCHAEKRAHITPYIATHVNFSGDYSGEMNFIFPKESVDVILERKYEKPQELDKTDHIDALKEFSSTIMDKLNANLEKIHYTIFSDFPMATDCKDINDECIEHTYILETFNCEGHPFYVTITDYFPEVVEDKQSQPSSL